MDTELFDQLRRTSSFGASRRRMLAALTGGLLTALPLALGIEAKTKKKGKNKKHSKRKGHEKSKNQDATPQPPPPPDPPLPPPPPPVPATKIDAVCTGPSDGYVSLGDNDRLAQTFTALASGPLVSAQLAITKQDGTDGHYILKLAPVDGSGVPTNDELAWSAAPNATVADGASMVTFPFADQVSVVAGAQYALVLSRPGTSHLQWDARDGNTCAGRSFVSYGPAAAFDDTVANLDFIFTTFVTS